MKTRLRFITPAIILLLSGAVVNVVIAWVCVARLPMPPTVAFVHERVTWPHPQDKWPNARQQWVREHRPYKVMITRGWSEAGYLANAIQFQTQMRTPGAAATQPFALFGNRRIFQQIDVEAGFPLRSLRMHGAQEYSAGGVNLADSWTASLPAWFKNRADAAAVVPVKGLPLMPMPIGFAVNSAVYGLFLGVVHAAMVSTRRAWRGHRHRCWSCGYPIGVSPRCTECGATLPARLVEPNTHSS